MSEEIRGKGVRSSRRMSPRTRNLIKLAVTILGTIAALVLVFALAQYLLPFLIAFIISQLFEPLMNRLIKSKVSRGLAALIAIVLLLAVLGLIIMVIVVVGVSEIRQLAQNLPTWTQNIYVWIDDTISTYKPMIERLHPQIADTLRAALTGSSATVGNWVNGFATSVLTKVISLPRVIIFITITILATVFMMRDRPLIMRNLRKQLPEKWIFYARKVRTDMFSALFGYIRAQLIMMSITFVELLIGLSLLGRPYVLLMSFIAALVDALPVFGVGLFLIPYGAVMLLQGQYVVGVGMLVLYGVIIIVRQSLEPRVLGKQIGIHPLITLMALYAGLQLMGVVGLIVGPVSVLILRNVLTIYMGGRTISDIINGVERKPILGEDGGEEKSAQWSEREGSADESDEKKGPPGDGARK